LELYNLFDTTYVAADPIFLLHNIFAPSISRIKSFVKQFRVISLEIKWLTFQSLTLICIIGQIHSSNTRSVEHKLSNGARDGSEREREREREREYKLCSDNILKL